MMGTDPYRIAKLPVEQFKALSRTISSGKIVKIIMHLKSLDNCITAQLNTLRVRVIIFSTS